MKTLHKDTVIFVGLIVLGVGLLLNWFRDIGESQRPPVVTLEDVRDIKRMMEATKDTLATLRDSQTTLGKWIESVERSHFEEVNERRREAIERTIPLGLKAVINARIDDVRARYDAGHLTIMEVAQQYDEIAKDIRSYARN